MKQIKFICNNGECENKCVIFINISDDADTDEVSGEILCILSPYDPCASDSVHAKWVISKTTNKIEVKIL